MPNDESIIREPMSDNFTTETPLRAFSDFTVKGLYAVGRGFRPALQHLSAYLDAIERREHWQLVQLFPDEHGKPSAAIFRSVPARQVYSTPELTPPDADDPKVKAAFYDPVNPKHYNGTACAEIGELLTPNAYQTLKYCWSLGEKDDPVIELGKAIWYWKREIVLFEGVEEQKLYAVFVRGCAFLEDRIEGRSNFTQGIARQLWHGYELGMRPDHRRSILETLEEQLFRLKDRDDDANI